jgi:hypothetical protein
MKKYNDCRFLAQANVGDSKVVLVQDTKTKKYFSYWGASQEQSRVEHTTPSGRKISESSAIKKFLEMVEASKYLQFNSL